MLGEQSCAPCWVVVAPVQDRCSTGLGVGTTGERLVGGSPHVSILKQILFSCPFRHKLHAPHSQLYWQGLGVRFSRVEV